MSDFLQYFEHELDYIRTAFDEFSKRHPQKADLLGISGGKSMDPDVQRLADSVALISARLHKRLDDTRPEISLDLMRLMCPSFLLGAPSFCAINPAPEEFAIDTKVKLERWNEVEIAQGDNRIATFSVAGDVDINPLKIVSFRTETAPFDFDKPQSLLGNEAAFCIVLASMDDETPISELKVDSIEFYLPSGSGRRYRLCDVLSRHVGAVSLAIPGTKMGINIPPNSFIPSLNVKSTTFLPEYLTQVPSIERLRDFFCYPDKGYFFTLKNIHEALKDMKTPLVEIRLFTNGRSANDVGKVELGDILTNVVPCINLFEVSSQPLRYSHARDRIPVTPRTGYGGSVDVLRVDEVRRLTPDGEILIPEMSSPNKYRQKGLLCWKERFEVGSLNHARRDISFSAPDLADGLLEPIDFVAKLICSNGNDSIAVRGSTDGIINVLDFDKAFFSLLEEPSSPVPPELEVDKQWDLVALINGNFGAIMENPEPTEAFREVMHLCSPSGYSQAANAIWDLNIKRSIAPVTIDNKVLLASGADIEVVLDIESLPYPAGIFAYILNDFFSAFLSYDRFIQLTVRSRGNDQPLICFDRRHGSQDCV